MLLQKRVHVFVSVCVRKRAGGPGIGQGAMVGDGEGAQHVLPPFLLDVQLILGVQTQLTECVDVG